MPAFLFLNTPFPEEIATGLTALAMTRKSGSLLRRSDSAVIGSSGRVKPHSYKTMRGMNAKTRTEVCPGDGYFVCTFSFTAKLKPLG